MEEDKISTKKQGYETMIQIWGEIVKDVLQGEKYKRVVWI